MIGDIGVLSCARWRISGIDLVKYVGDHHQSLNR